MAWRRAGHAPGAFFARTALLASTCACFSSQSLEEASRKASLLEGLRSRGMYADCADTREREGGELRRNAARAAGCALYRRRSLFKCKS